MGSTIELNDTLQITAEQGFPKELDVARHQQKPFTAEDFAGRVFEFTYKPGIRAYQQPPVWNFLVENRDGKWIYWGLVHILSINHDYQKQTTSGTFKIVYLYTPDEMKIAHHLIDRNSEHQFFSK